MKARYLTPIKIITVSLTLLLILGLSIANATGTDHMATYRVTIMNLSYGQPLSPPVVATHRPEVGMFRFGELASRELEALAENGDQIQLYDLLSESPEVTEVVDVGVPLMPRDQTHGDFTDSVTFEISARPGDRLSLATMLICSNDGFVGLNRVRLPRRAQRVLTLHGYDAGTEDNTEMSRDIVDPCSDLGPLALDGDPNGNENALVDTEPHHQVLRHRGVRGAGDLSIDDHGWLGPIGVAIVKRID